MIHLLKVLRVLDEDGTVSLSNLLLMVLTVKIAIAPDLDWTVVSGLALSLLNYGHRKILRNKAQTKQQDSKDELAQIKASLDELSQQVALVKLEG
jgi:hypothetical protein